MCYDLELSIVSILIATDNSTCICRYLCRVHGGEDSMGVCFCLSCGSQGSTLNHQAWQNSPLPTEISCCP